jgi:hypothetical protein
VAKILALRDIKVHEPHRCRMKRPKVPVATLHMAAAPSTLPVSSTAQRYTPSGYAIVRGPSPPPACSSPTNTAPSTGPSTQGASVTNQHVQLPMVASISPTRGWVLFGVEGGYRTLTPAEILVDDQSTDHSFFRELKRCYKAIWRLDYCEVVRVLSSASVFPSEPSSVNFGPTNTPFSSVV